MQPLELILTRLEPAVRDPSCSERVRNPFESAFPFVFSVSYDPFVSYIMIPVFGFFFFVTRGVSWEISQISPEDRNSGSDLTPPFPRIETYIQIARSQ